MQVIAILGSKGGCGKTTLAQNLAVAAQASGKSVAIIDLDKQATSADWVDRRGDENLAVISTHPARLRQSLESAQRAGADVVFIDTPAGDEAGAMAIAARPAHLVLMPLRPEFNDVHTLPTLKDALALSGAAPRAWVVFNASKGNRHLEAKEVAESAGFEVCPVVLRSRVAYPDGQKRAKGVMEVDSRGGAAEELKALYKFTSSKLKSERTKKEAE